MNDFTTNLATLLVRELNAFARELDLFPDNETVWKAAPGVTNSAANSEPIIGIDQLSMTANQFSSSRRNCSRSKLKPWEITSGSGRLSSTTPRA